MNDVSKRPIPTDYSSSCETIHGDVHHHNYDKDFDPNKWRFSVERITLFICVTVLLSQIIWICGWQTQNLRYNKDMKKYQTKRLERLLRSESQQLNYILAVMLTEFEKAMKEEPERMRSEYGDYLFHYIGSLTHEKDNVIS